MLPSCEYPTPLCPLRHLLWERTVPTHGVPVSSLEIRSAYRHHAPPSLVTHAAVRSGFLYVYCRSKFSLLQEWRLPLVRGGCLELLTSAIAHATGPEALSTADALLLLEPAVAAIRHITELDGAGYVRVSLNKGMIEPSWCFLVGLFGG